MISPVCLGWWFLSRRISETWLINPLLKDLFLPLSVFNSVYIKRPKPRPNSSTCLHKTQTRLRRAAVELTVDTTWRAAGASTVGSEPTFLTPGVLNSSLFSAFIGVLKSSLHLCGKGVGESREDWNICGLPTKELECPSLNWLMLPTTL